MSIKENCRFGISKKWFGTKFKTINNNNWLSDIYFDFGGVTMGAFLAIFRLGSSSELDSDESESLLDDSSDEAELEDFDPLLRKGEPFLSTSESSSESLDDDDEPLLPDDELELELDEDELDSFGDDGTKNSGRENDELVTLNEFANGVLQMNAYYWIW